MSTEEQHASDKVDGADDTGFDDFDAADRLARRRRRSSIMALSGSAVVALVIAGVWSQREPIARDFIEKELERRGVTARYDLAAIGFRTQRIENLSLGDPQNPDLTAQWAEIHTRLGFFGFEVTEVRAHDVHLRGRLQDGSFRFGELDKLLPEPSGKPFALPDLRVAVSDATARLEMPNGVVGVALNGEGNLANGFQAKLAASAPKLAFASCALVDGKAHLDVAIRDRRPSITGPVRAANFSCPDTDLVLTRPKTVIEAAFNEALDQWQGSAGVDVAQGAFARNRLSEMIGTIGFEGDAAATHGKLKMTVARLAANGAVASAISLGGDYKLATARKGATITLDGSAETTRLAMDRTSRAQIASLGTAANGTPLGPLLASLARAADRAAAGSSVSGSFRVAHVGSAGALHIRSLAAISDSGARASLSGGKGLRVEWPGAGKYQLDGKVTLGGGGFPATVLALRQARPGGPIDGVAQIAAMEVEGAKLSLTPIAFRADPDGGSRFDTRLTLDGPLGDGRVAGLSLPLNGRIDSRGGFLLNPNCVPVSFAALQMSGVALGRHDLRLCPAFGPALYARNASDGVSGGGRVDGLRLQGRMGANSLALTAKSLAYGIARAAVQADSVALRMGRNDGETTRLDIASIEGAVRGGAVAGRFDGLEGKLANVPLDIDEAAGQWSFDKGALGLAGHLRVSDAMTADVRFNPLISRDFALEFRNGRITAGGTLLEPKSGLPVTRVAIAHGLSSGAGNAVLDVENLRFNDSLQPDTLTPKALGVVANVNGAVSGRGEIRWDAKGVTSDGVFRTQNTNLAAAFGPVTALAGEIRFTDLLGMVTAPGQQVFLGEVNPGVAVLNGVINYQLLPDFKIAVEGGRWPFAGGELILEPAVLDMAEEHERRLTFKVIGLDAAQFINQFEMKDISATGTFDGVLPMVFDAQGGRIEGGRLVVRRGGGALAYVGQVSNEQLGTFGTMAFDALKSMRYDSLVIELNGAIDGEMITAVRFSGVNEGTVEVAEQSFVREFVGLPFIFNITVKAPFRGLLNTARSFTDPGLLIRQNLPGYQPAEAPPEPVQPKESESMQ